MQPEPLVIYVDVAVTQSRPAPVTFMKYTLELFKNSRIAVQSIGTIGTVRKVQLAFVACWDLRPQRKLQLPAAES